MSNVAKLRPQDAAFGRALCEFGRMIEDGRALGRAASRPVVVRPPPYRDGDFRMTDRPTAENSIRRARSQHAKGRMTAAELAQIEARYRKEIKFFDGAGT